jgi:hypothetical protein
MAQGQSCSRIRHALRVAEYRSWSALQDKAKRRVGEFWCVGLIEHARSRRLALPQLVISVGVAIGKAPRGERAAERATDADAACGSECAAVVVQAGPLQDLVIRIQAKSDDANQSGTT